MTPMLELRGLTSHYGPIQALHGIDLQIRPGELVALVGANGAGKSTLLRCISGVQPVSGGVLRFEGRDLLPTRPDVRVRLGISQVPEGRQVFGPMSVEDHLRLGAFVRKDSAAIDQDIEAMLTLFPVLRDRLRQAAGTLSGGQQQMLAMTRALMCRPRLLLLDEPSMGLAPLVAQEILGIVRKLRDQGSTILLVEQNARAALSIADRAYVMETGRIALSGTGADLLADDAVQAAYLGA
jgi:branched-chain amino acid transport system ATP-binding protein